MRNALPTISQKTIESYEMGNDLSLDLVKHKPNYHKTYMARYDSHKLQRFK